MKKVILYGGAFNPPTIAHTKVLEACIAYADTIDAEVWLLPSGTRKDKSIITTHGDRLELAEALVRSANGKDRVKICAYELDRPGLTQTHVTRSHLRESYPDTEFIWVFGSDSIVSMRSLWIEGDRLWNELEMLIVRRPGCPLGDLPPKAEVLEIETQNVSSTLVRECIQSGKDYSMYVSSEVYTTLQKSVTKKELQ
jgi:nicotinate-nucleotide adenylyltransferase